jgi:hypothetical protein
MTGPAHSDDDLLVALDQLVNTVHWLRTRTPYTASEALTEALTDWLAQHTNPPDEMTADDRNVDLGDVLAQVIVVADRLAANDAAPGIEGAVAEAVNAWTAAVSAEHHHSQPFPHQCSV